MTTTTTTFVFLLFNRPIFQITVRPNLPKENILGVYGAAGRPFCRPTDGFKGQKMKYISSQ